MKLSAPKLFILSLISLIGATQAQNEAPAAVENTSQTQSAPAANNQPAPNNSAPALAPEAAPQTATPAPNRFQELREKRLEEARAYQEAEAQRAAERERQRLEAEAAKLEAERQEYASDKEAFLAQFKKKNEPTPTPTPSVLEELELRRAQEAAGGAAGEEAPSGEQGF